MRSGLWASGSGGSGILIARKTDGTWSPPSGLELQTPSLGFVLGVDIYDCVLIINSFTVLEAFARSKLTLGTDVVLSTGPLVSLGLLENDVTWTDLSDAAITYVKSRGHFSEAKLDGTVLQERREENERFYGMTLGVAKILAGDINQSLPQVRPLTEVLKAAEGRVDYDTALVESLSSQPVPSDAKMDSPGTPHPSPAFGLPVSQEADPFGVLALEMAGIGIREAGTHLRPESSQFEYHPSPSSPIFPRVKRSSVDTSVSRSNRGSFMSGKTVGTEKSHTTDACTQTFSTTPETTPAHSQSQSEDGHQQHSSDEVQKTKGSTGTDFTPIDISALRMLSNFPDLDEPVPESLLSNHDASAVANVDGNDEKMAGKDANNETTNDRSPISTKDNENEGDADDEEDSNGSIYHSDNDAGVNSGESDSDNDEESDEEEEAVVFEVATAQAPTRLTLVGTQMMQAKGAVVNIPKRVPPPLPTRSPARASRRQSQMPNVGSLVGSPLRQEFDPVEISGSATPRASQALGSPRDDGSGEVTPESSQGTVDAKNPENHPDSGTDLGPEPQEWPVKQTKPVVSTSPPAGQPDLDADHKVTVTVS